MVERSASKMCGHCCPHTPVCQRHREFPRKKLLTWAVETFYDKCAAFNLRYVPYRTSFDRQNCLHNSIKAVVMLLVFLMANFVVFLTILCKLAIHLAGVFLDAVDWVLHALVVIQLSIQKSTQDIHLKKRLNALINTRLSLPSLKTEKNDYLYPRVVE